MRSEDSENPWAVSSANMYGGYGPGGSASQDAPNYTGARWAPADIKLGTGFGSSLTITGDVDLAVKGSAVVTDPYYADSSIDDKDLAVINMNGGNITIETPESDKDTYYALANYGGTININMPYDVPGEKDVNIKGNIIVMKEDAGNRGGTNFYRDGEINMALF